MSENETIVTHPEFPRWYGSLGFEENRDRLHRRFRGLSVLNSSLTPADVESLLRVVFQARLAPSPDALARIRKPFKDADDLFEMKGNDRELEVLCASALAILFENDTHIAAVGAMAATTAALNGARVLHLPIDLPALAERSIGRMAETRRKRPDLRQHVVACTGLDFTAADVIQKVAAQLAGAIENVDTYIAIQDEELEMLWWAFGERSNDFDCPFEKVPIGRRPLVFAKELADLTHFLPGPTSAKALLARAGLQDREQITIPDAVNACETSWLTSLEIHHDVSPVLAPVHSAIFRKLETGDQTSWAAGWSAVSGIDQSHSLSSLTLGNLFYRERLFDTVHGA